MSDATPGQRPPERTCVGCGKKAPKEEFLRFAYSPDGEVICDARKRIQSRGVYFCASKPCIVKGIKKKAFARFLRFTGAEPEIDVLRRNIEAGFKEYAYSIMNMALKSKKIVAGDSSVSDAFSKNKAVLLLLADNAGAGVGKKFLKICKERSVPVIHMEAKGDIAEKLGIKTTAVFAVVDGGFSAGLERAWRVMSEVKSWKKM